MCCLITTPTTTSRRDFTPLLSPPNLQSFLCDTLPVFSPDSPRWVVADHENEGKENGVVSLSPEEQGSLKPAELVIKMWKGHDRAQKMEEWDTGSRKMLSTRLWATRRFELKINEKIAYREGGRGGRGKRG